jgi:hypothetical protein
VFEIFGSVLDRLQGLFGKRFLVTGLGPVLVLLGMSVIPALHLSPDLRDLIDDVAAQSAARQTVIGFTAALAIGLAGFVLFMANAAWRSVLERGPAGLLERPWWRESQLKRRRALAAQLTAMRPDLVNLRFATNPSSPTGWPSTLRAARTSAPAGSGTGKTVAETILTQFETLELAREHDRPIAFDTLQALVDRLDAELRAKQANELPALDRIHVQFVAIADFALRKLETAFARVQSELRVRFPADETRVTGSVLGNITAAGSDYFHVRFGMNIEIVWPLVEAAAARDASPSMPDALSEARTRIDFCVAMNAIFLVYGIGWFIALAVARGGMPWLFGVAVAGVGGALVFYQLAVWNTRIFQSWVRSAVELYRFSVLQSLHIGLPADSAAERKAWLELTRLAELGEGVVTFTHPAHQ